MYYHYVATPALFPRPWVQITADELGITTIYFVDDQAYQEKKNIHTKQCAKELKEYFSHKRKSFSVALNPQGTEFQQKVWQQLRKIPFGGRWSYKDLALTLGSANYCRAVGMANSRNPISLIIPCHRVIGHDGKLVGYTGGLNIKDWLLAHEAGRKLVQLARNDDDIYELINL